MHLKYFKLLFVMLFAATNNNMYADRHHDHGHHPRHHDGATHIHIDRDPHHHHDHKHHDEFTKNNNSGYKEAARTFLVGTCFTFLGIYGSKYSNWSGDTKFQVGCTSALGSLVVNAGWSYNELQNNPDTEIIPSLQISAALGGCVLGGLLGIIAPQIG